MLHALARARYFAAPTLRVITPRTGARSSLSRPAAASSSPTTTMGKSSRRAAAAAAASDPLTPPLAGRRARSSAAAALAVGAPPAAPLGGEEAADAALVEEAAPAKRRRGRKAPDPLPCADPTPALLAALAAFTPAPRPVPNLGYACLNSELRALEPPVFTSRDCIKRTLDAKGPEFLGALCLANCRDLAKVVQWNHERGVRLFRMSSVLWPWMGAFEFAALPQAAEIAAALRFAGDLARAYDQRLTFHPSHFVKLAAPSKALVAKSAAELEAHSQILDLMGYAPSPVNKINIHVGGVYKELGDKAATLRRWAAGFARLSPSCAARITVENDDVPNSFSLEDLLPLHAATGVPLVFDFHHHRFCPGGLTEEAALRAALATWPRGVRPVVHWSESQEGRRPHAHSDYVKGPIFLHGFEREVDVMIEAKAKEQALLAYRDGAPIPQASYF